MALVAVTDVLSTMLGHATPAKGEKLQSDVIVSTENLVSRQLILCRVALEDFFPVLRQLWLTPTPGSQHRGGQTLRGRPLLPRVCHLQGGTGNMDTMHIMTC